VTFSREDKRDWLRARCSDDLLERVEDFADEHELSKSDVIRTAVREYLPNDDIIGPQSQQLREVYLWLLHRSNDQNRITGKMALNELSQTLSMKEEFVKSSRLVPLERNGWIRASKGIIEVIER
jgi:Arc/MetJ-type ribon-helix-helix transcriptional regulator